MIEYWLKTSPSSPVVLEIKDASGSVVRRFSSADNPQPLNDKELNVPTYWIRPTRAVSAAPGMHRFIWDLHSPEPDVLEHEYPISAIVHDTPRYPLGASALPGEYSIILTIDGKAYTQPLHLTMDPRVKTSPDDLRRQFDLDRKIADALHRDWRGIQQVRSLRSQLKSLTTKNPSASLASKIADLEKKAATLEGDADTPRYLSTPDGRSLARLNAGLGTLLSAVDSADAAPTTQQSAMFADLDKALTGALADWQQLKTKEVEDVNTELKTAGLPVIDLTKVPAESSTSTQTTTQDKDRNEE
jgi:hypothetical protein